MHCPSDGEPSANLVFWWASRDRMCEGNGSHYNYNVSPRCSAQGAFERPSQPASEGSAITW